jgi:hypothetical protein
MCGIFDVCLCICVYVCVCTSHNHAHRHAYGYANTHGYSIHKTNDADTRRYTNTYAPNTSRAKLPRHQEIHELKKRLLAKACSRIFSIYCENVYVCVYLYTYMYMYMYM